MNFLGIGPLELLVVFAVAFLALGPAKSIEMARTTGKMLRDLRRAFNEVMSAVNLEDDDSRSSPGRRPRTPGPPGDATPNESPGPREDAPRQNPP